MSSELFRDDAYLTTCEAKVVAIAGDRIILDQTVFYPRGGGQPGDSGQLVWETGGLRVTDTVRDESGQICHLCTAVEGVAVGDRVRAEIDWPRRHRHMRMHSALHLLCALIDHPVTGGSIGDGSGRLDFDMSDGVDKAQLEADLNRLVASRAEVSSRWITDQQLDANPELVRTLSVSPPRGQGRVRLVEVAGVDLQPCGGTHVANIGEIGQVRVGKVEKKGRQNRRIQLLLD